MALVLVNDTAIESVWDCTQPAGPLYAGLSIPAHDSILDANWVGGAAGTIGAGVSGDAWIMPRMFAGDPTAKLIGVELKYALPPGTLVSIESVAPGVAATVAVLRPSIQSDLSLDALPHTTKIDLRGYPILAGNAGGGKHQAIYGHGGTTKQGQFLGQNQSVAVHVSGQGTFHSVKWYWAKG